MRHRMVIAPRLPDCSRTGITRSQFETPYTSPDKVTRARFRLRQSLSTSTVLLRFGGSITRPTGVLARLLSSLSITACTYPSSPADDRFGAYSTTYLLSLAAPGCAHTERGLAAHRSARPEALCEKRPRLSAPVW